MSDLQEQRQALWQIYKYELQYRPHRFRVIFLNALGICGICGTWVNPKNNPRDPKHGTIDHVVPLSKGGCNIFSNLQLAHAECNHRKGNGDRDEH